MTERSFILPYTNHFFQHIFILIDNNQYLMNTINLNNRSINNFFGFLYKLDTNSKKQLIIKLTESIEETKTKEKNIASLFGSWKDNRDSDLIIKEIKESRTTNREILEF